MDQNSYVFYITKGKNTISKTMSNDVTLPPIVVPRLTQCKVAWEYCDLKGKNTSHLLSVTLAKKKKVYFTVSVVSSANCVIDWDLHLAVAAQDHKNHAMEH